MTQFSSGDAPVDNVPGSRQHPPDKPLLLKAPPTPAVPISAGETRQRRARRLAQEAKRVAAQFIQALDYQVCPTTYGAPFALWVRDEAERTVRVEAKIGLYHRTQRGRGRYQAYLSHPDEADILVFIARNAYDWPFVIPMPALASRRNISIWSCDPAEYTGQWAPYLGAWTHLHEAIKIAEPCSWQFSLFD